MKKTFWSVKYTGTFVGTMLAWFDNEADANEFAKGDYREDPVKHTVNNPDEFYWYEDKVRMTNVMLKQ